MADKKDLIVEGFFFGSYDDAKQANKEIKNAQYLDQRVNTMSSKQKLALYDKMLDEKVFNTPVGWEYLKYLRASLIEEGVDESLIRPIPLYITFTGKNDDGKEYSHIAKMKIAPQKSELNSLKEKNRIMLIAILVLIGMVISMFVITTKSSTPNIINYKTAILNQYSEWEEELKEKEADLRQRERRVQELEGSLEVDNTSEVDSYEDFSGWWWRKNEKAC